MERTEKKKDIYLMNYALINGFHSSSLGMLYFPCLPHSRT